ncbi:ComEC/Rec2 family competence protein [Dactylosporangium sp. CA-052675]|uniref:ComEC/Rec2 family competence protein n=1 Tax=Dactylosporangium sp. CA-052675 TaxID=3239927 RepID=UPI003D8C9B99
MTWTLEIHHLDIGMVGDATIIVARHPGNPPAQAAIRRTVLIDGGKTGSAPTVDTYLANTLNIPTVDVIAVTHFDEDHFYGISRLLQNNIGRYNDAILYDTGRLDGSEDTRYTEDGHGVRHAVDSEYYDYRTTAANKPGPFVYATQHVNSFDIVDYNGAGQAVIPRGVVNARPSRRDPAARNWREPHWLLGKDIMWGNGLVEPNWAVSAVPVYAPGRPSLMCVTANKYVLQPGGGMTFCSNQPVHAENDDENPKSLGFLLTFGNFKYFVAGDLERAQEDGHVNHEMVPVLQNGVKFRLNPTDDLAGRVLVVKSSHHGSNSATSWEFITRVRPAAAIISTGPRNRHHHPAESTINVLDGYPELPILGDPTNANRHPPEPPPPPRRPVEQFLTGYREPNVVPPLSYGGTVSQTAGHPANGLPGHIVVRVTEAQSVLSPVGQIRRGVIAAGNAANAVTGYAPALGLVDQVGEAGGARGVVQAAARATGATDQQATQALTAVMWLGDLENNGNPVHGLVTQAGAAATAPGATPASIDGVINAYPLAIRTSIGGPGMAIIRATMVTAAGPGYRLGVANAATAAGATVDEALAASVAATVAYAANNGRDDAAYAGIAAYAAAHAGATAAQAAVLGAAMGALVLVLDATRTARIVVDAARHAALNAQLTAPHAAFAAAVTAAAHYLGEPNDVRDGVRAALLRIGLAGGAANGAGNAAHVAADAVNPATLFTVSYDSVNGPMNLDIK